MPLVVLMKEKKFHNGKGRESKELERMFFLKDKNISILDENHYCDFEENCFSGENFLTMEYGTTP